MAARHALRLLLILAVTGAASAAGQGPVVEGVNAWFVNPTNVVISLKVAPGAPAGDLVVWKLVVRGKTWGEPGMLVEARNGYKARVPAQAPAAPVQIKPLDPLEVLLTWNGKPSGSYSTVVLAAAPAPTRPIPTNTVPPVQPTATQTPALLPTSTPTVSPAAVVPQLKTPTATVPPTVPIPGLPPLQDILGTPLARKTPGTPTATAAVKTPEVDDSVTSPAPSATESPAAAESPQTGSPAPVGLPPAGEPDGGGGGVEPWKLAVAAVIAVLAIAGWLLSRKPAGAAPDSKEKEEDTITLEQESRSVKVERKIAQGGLCNILAIRQSGVKDLRILKILREEFQSSARMRASVKEEGRLLRQLNEKHPDEIFIRIFEDGAIHDPLHGEVPYLILEYADGENLRSYVRKNGPLPAAELVDLMRALINGLKILHEEGFIHGDLSPENLMRLAMPADPKRGRWRLLDFGEAVRHQSAERTGEITGKPEFISPEQARGFSATSSSDMYSLGMVIFFLQTGTPAFKADNPAEVLKKHESGEIVFPVSFPPLLKNLVVRLTAKLPIRRPPAATLLAQLDAIEKVMR